MASAVSTLTFRRETYTAVRGITATEWTACGLFFALTWLGALIHTEAAVASMLIACTALSFFLVANRVGSILRGAAPGPLLLWTSMSVFFWIDAASASLADPRFPTPVEQVGGNFDLEYVIRSAFSLSIFQLGLTLGYALRPSVPVLSTRALSRSDSTTGWRANVPYLLVLVSFAGLIAAYGLNASVITSALIASRSGFDADGESSILANHLATFGIFASSLFFARATTQRGGKRLLSLLLGLVGALPFVSSGARHLAVYIFLPPSLWFLRKHAQRPGVLLKAGLIAIALIAIFQLQLAVRSAGWDKVGTIHTKDMLDVNPTGQFSALELAHYLVPAEHDYFHEFVEPYFLFHWVPRAIWPDKPIPQSWDYYNRWYTRGEQFNVTPSVIGQFQMNFGNMGVIYIGILLGLLTFMLDRIYSGLTPDHRAALVLVGLWYAFVISSFRFFHPLYLAYVLFGHIAFVAVTRKRSVTPAWH